MIKYKDCQVVFEEIPDMVSLAINITNCQNNCKGCHTPELRKNIGKELTDKEIDELLKNNDGVNCVILMGEGKDKKRILEISNYIHRRHNLKTALYSGRSGVESEILNEFDYVKIGPYIEKYGPLNKKTTNQRLYELTKKEDGSVKDIIDITSKFWDRV